ncbi:phosphoenolpyruvate synthase [Lactovum odontotermitis]
MTRDDKYVLWFDELKREDVALVGGKSSSLGEMTSIEGIPVPYGFATTAFGYQHFMEATGLVDRIARELEGLTDVENSQQLHTVAGNIREMIQSVDMPEDLAKDIRESYEELARRAGDSEPFVAVRSSATAEDLPDASFAGQQDTYLNVRGADNVAQRVKDCYASLFTDRATYYRTKQGFDHMKVALSAAVQMMVFSKASGVMFSINVSTGNDKIIDIEAAWGLGEYVVQGTVTPDNYLVNKDTLTIADITVNNKKVRLVRKPDGDCIEEKVPEDEAKAQVLTDDQIIELAGYVKKLEQHYGVYMDTEFALDERTNKLWMLQARPETVWARKAKAQPKPGSEEREKNAAAVTITRDVVVRGLPASPGRAAGKAHIIFDPKDIDQFNEGEILVTTMTTPDWVPAMKKARAIVTNAGGMTCHAAIVSRELGIPCIVGTEARSEIEATRAIENDQIITVDATNGIVYDGIIADLVKEKNESTTAVAGVAEVFPTTATKIYMNLGDPDLADKYSSLPADGIGLMREEFIWTTFIHEHPLYLIETGRSDVVVDQLAEGIRKVCQALAPRQVVLRLSDFKSSEYRDLKGGDKYEPEEPSALLGWRGASRYYDPKYLPAFKLELEAVKKVRDGFGFKNLQIMIPFCRTVEEAKKVTKIMEAQGLERGNDFKIWLMAEIPSNIILADQFNQFIDGYSIGSNDLTMLILGCDRDNDTVQSIYDERNLAVRRAVRHLIEVAHKDGKTVSICGQAPSVYPDFCEFLVRSGVDSISVNPDAVKNTKRMVAQLEQRIMLDSLTGRGKVESTELDW